MNYLVANAKDSDVIATRQFDLDTERDESYYWYSALSGRTVVSEGAKYGSLLAAVADTNSEKGLHPVPATWQLLLDRRAQRDTIYTSHDSANVIAAIAKVGVSFILEDASAIDAPGEVYRSRIGKLIFANEGDTIWKVR